MNRLISTGALLLSLALAGCPAQQTTPPVTPKAPENPTADNTPPTPETPPAPPAQPVAQPQALTFPANDAFRDEQPEAGKPRPLQIPPIKVFKLKNGVTAYLVERPELPTVSIELNFDGGSMNDPKGKEGLADICMGMMSEGTKSLEKIPYDEALADIASNIDSYAGRETQGVAMSTLSKHFDATFKLYVDTLLQPGFRQEDFDRMIKRQLESLKQAKGSAAAVAGRVSDAVLFGTKHPFGSIVTEASLKGLTIKDCVDYHDRYVKPKGARLFVVGRMTEADVRKAMDAPELAAWKGAPKRGVRLGRPRSMKGHIFFVNIPDAAQSQIYVMNFGPKRKAKDFFANSMASAIFGGGFASRLNMNLREDKGYSYGARGGFQYSHDYGEFVAHSSVRSDSTWQSVLEMHNELADMKSGKKPATAEELSREQNGAILSLPGRFATSRQVLGAYRSLVYYGLPLNYYNSYVDKVGAVTLKQVAKSAKRYFEPNRAIILVVGSADSAQKKHENGKDVPMVGADGKPVTLLDGLTELAKKGTVGKGSLVVLDADGKVLETRK